MQIIIIIIFIGLILVFLNDWLTVSEAANCLTDLVECFSDSVID